MLEKRLELATWAYLLFPWLPFALGWMRPWVAIVLPVYFGIPTDASHTSPLLYDFGYDLPAVRLP